jgi:mannitol/fructose-specific phosphotransferase system IIA component (Ntr-type)/Kef-type K+ transport system membrane component KefB
MAALGLLVLAAHLGGRLCDKLRLPVPAGQLLGGVIAGPWVLHMVGVLPDFPVAYDTAVGSFNFFIFTFVSLVAFSIGEELHMSRLRTVGKSALVICLCQAAVTFVLVSLGLILLGRMPVLQATLIGAIGIVMAPEVTFIILNRLKIEGRLRNMLGSVEILCDIIGVMIFTVLVECGVVIQSGAEFSFATARWRLFLPVVKDLFLAHLIGVAIFIVLRALVRRKGKALIPHTHDTELHDGSLGLLHRVLAEHPSPSAEIFVVVVSSVSIGAGFAHYFHLPFLATSAVAGFLVANFHSHAIFDSLKITNISALLNLGFFAIVGSTIRFDSFDSTVAVYILIYVCFRALGKIVGTWIGCKVVKEDKKVASCFPYLMFPQAAVAAVEAIYAGTLLGDPVIPAVVLPAIVIFEVGGVIMSDRVLSRWRSWIAGEGDFLEIREAEEAVAASDMLLNKLSPASIKLDLKHPLKLGAIEEMVDHAVATSDQLLTSEEPMQLILEREQLMPTGMGHGIALPHCRLLALDHAIVVFGRHSDGVVFGGIDNEPCNLIVLLLSGAGDPSQHIKLLSAIAGILGEEEVREELLNAPDSDSFLQIIKTAAGGA